MTLTATYHTLNFNSLSYDKFEDLCFWIVEDLGEYKLIERYGGTGDKNRDVVAYTFDDELDYFQCKRYEDPNYGVLEKELGAILQHINAGEIKKPRRIYFVLSSNISSGAKDKLKKYATTIGLSEPSFWEPVILDKKVKKSADALKNFFNIFDKKEEEHSPQVDTTGLIAYGTQETTFKIVNNGDSTAIDCSWYLLGFGWAGYHIDTVFDLKPAEEKELRLSLPGQFMGQKPIKELRFHFKFRDNKNNWYYSERYLNPELVGSGEFYRINAIAGQYIPARPLPSLFIIDAIEQLERTGLNETRFVSYTYNGISKSLKINISTTLASVWQFTQDEMESAFKELSEKRIAQMIKTNNFEDDFYVNIYLKPTQNTGFEAYKELRDSIL